MPAKKERSVITTLFLDCICIALYFDHVSNVCIAIARGKRVFVMKQMLGKIRRGGETCEIGITPSCI